MPDPIIMPAPIKSGWQTSEFWITVLTAIGAIASQYGGLVPSPWGVIVMGIGAAAYAISRGLAKSAGLGTTPSR